MSCRYTKLTSKVAKAMLRCNPDIEANIKNISPDVPNDLKEGGWDKWRAYKKKVWEITNVQDIPSLDNFMDRAFYDHQLDHKISISYGFKNNIPPERIGHISNLRFIPWVENRIKNRDSLVGDIVIKY